MAIIKPPPISAPTFLPLIASDSLVKALFLAFEQLPSSACGGQGEKEGGEGEEGWIGREGERKRAL